MVHKSNKQHSSTKTPSSQIVSGQSTRFYKRNKEADLQAKRKIGQYYDGDTAGDLLGLPGAGIIALMSGDQLHPPMVFNDKFWSDGRLWQEGATESVRQLANLAGINANSRVLDVGCGIGGASRLLAKEYGCNVKGLNISSLQIETAKLMTSVSGLADKISFIIGDAESIPFPDSSFNHVWSMNMFYHIPDKTAAFKEFARVIESGGLQSISVS